MTTPTPTLVHGKLGCKPPVITDAMPKLYRLAAYKKAPPPKIVRTIDPHAQMLGNDLLGDCTAAGLGNLLSAFTALNTNGHAYFPIDTTHCEQFYSESTGYVPGDASTDNGGIITDVLTKAQTIGYPSKYQRFRPLWGTADVDDVQAMGNIMESFGAAYLGVALAAADQYAEVWDTNTPGDQTPWSWGGHCLLGFDYEGLDDTDIVRLITWGGFKKCTWRWLKSRVIEIHAVAFRQIMPADGVNVLSHSDWEKLVADNAHYLSGVNAG